ncbi:hypothetical protein RSUY_47300 (plasmid) [Ralstonia solanacearum]|nr:hypothetical protein [Ralstonia solanacearum]ALF91032.1 hypothetical protein RSUY_47300 [Ralstonia solanacearum]
MYREESEQQQDINVNMADRVQTVLVLNDRARTVLPYSTEAFKMSTGSRSRVLDRHLDALVVYRDGSAFRLDAIQFEGLWGNRLWQRGFSVANGCVRQISVTLRRLESFAYETIQRQILEYVQFNPTLIDLYFKEGADPSSVAEHVRGAMDCRALFDVLKVPAPQDALDSLS